jgi:hypothetical protein
MGSRTVAINQENVSVKIRILDDTNGTPYTGMTAATSGHEIWYQRGDDVAVVTDSASAGDLSTITSAHSDWNFKHVTDGLYRVDYPDAAFAEGAGTVTLGMKATGYSCIPVEVDIEPALKYQGTPSSVTSTTTTFPAGTTPLLGDRIMVVDGTGEPGNVVMVTSATGEVATHPEFETGISATTTTVLLIAGDSTSATGAINSDAAASTLATPAQVNAECDTAISDAALATADKMEAYFQLALRDDAAINTDRATELSEINADEGSGAGNYDNTVDAAEHGNVKRINNTSVVGAGTDGDKWRA